MNTASSSLDAAAKGQDEQAPGAAAGSHKPSYGQILRSSALVGGASALSILIGIVRTKAVAVMLGPAGLGLMGAFNAIVDFAASVAGLGVARSGVRLIAESVGSGDTRRVALTVTVLRRAVIVLGVAGALLLAMLAHPVAVLSFGNAEHAAAVSLLGLAVLFKLVADGQSALLQGLRRIGDLSMITIISAAASMLSSIALVYFLREDGLALTVVAIAAVTLAISWWYSRKTRVERLPPAGQTLRGETKALLQFGMAFMVTGMLTMGATYIVRVILLRLEGLEPAGHYQAAWTLGGMYVSLVLHAMGTDFYPRLVAAAGDCALCNRLVNEQTQVSLLLSSFGVLATMTLAPLALVVFYSSAFVVAAEALRWICLGMALRVLSWPMGYVIIAKGAQRLYMLTELAWVIVNVGLSYVLVRAFGLVGAAAAFCLSYAFHGLLIYPFVRRLSGFAFDPRTTRIALGFGLVMAAQMLACQFLSWLWATIVGAVLLLLSAVVSMRLLLDLFPTTSIPRQLRWLLRLSGARTQATEADDR